MSTEALATWLRVRRNQAVETKSLREEAFPSTADDAKLQGNSTILSRSAQPLHHRIFWREETTSASLWEGAHRAIEAEKRQKVAPPKPGGPDHDEKGEQQVRSTEEEHGEIFSDPLLPATVLREVSKYSDLRRLARLLAERNLDFGRPEPFTAALHDGNPAVVELILRHEREHGGAAFTRSFRSWVIDVGDDDDDDDDDGDDDDDDDGDSERSPRCLPLHASCHAGSPEMLSVLLEFIADSYSVEDQAAMVNARDLNGRSALHLASWSPRPQCPGKRKAMIRNLLAHNADVHLKDNHGRTALHRACQAGDCLSVETILKAGADPLEADKNNLTPVETAHKTSRPSVDGVFRKHLPPATYLRLCAAVSSKDVVAHIMHQFVTPCSTCRVRPAGKCETQKRNNFAAWLFTHKRWPKADEGKWQEVRPSCVEKKPPIAA